jgi:hypothetical protein
MKMVILTELKQLKDHPFNVVIGIVLTTAS